MELFTHQAQHEYSQFVSSLTLTAGGLEGHRQHYIILKAGQSRRAAEPGQSKRAILFSCARVPNHLQLHFPSTWYPDRSAQKPRAGDEIYNHSTVLPLT